MTMPNSLGFEDYPDIQPVGTVSDGLPPPVQSLGLADPTAGIGDTSALPVARAAPSLGLAGPAMPAMRPQSDQDYLSNLPTAEKIGLMMQEFSAGVAGRPSPIDQVLKQKRAKEVQGMQDLNGMLTLIKTGTEIVRKLPQGSLQRNAVLAELGKVAPHLAPIFNAAGSENDDAIKNYLDIFGDPEVKQMAVKLCAQSPDFAGCILTISKDNDWSKRAERVVNDKHRPALNTKMRGFAESMKMRGKTSFTLSDIEAENKDNAIFSSGEMLAIGRITRDEDYWADLGLKSKAVQQAGDIAREQAKAKPDSAAKTEWIGMPGEMKQQAVIDTKGNIVRMLGSPIAAHSPAVNVYSGSLTPGIDTATGKPIYVQGSGRPDVPPRKVEGVVPPEAAGVRKEDQKKAEDAATYHSIDKQITELADIVSKTQGKFTGATGIGGLIRRTGETIVGNVVNPDIPTPALDAAAKKELLVANLRKKMADANMSKADKEALDTAMGGITSMSATKGSTLRALENLRGFVRDKYLMNPRTGKGGGDKFEVGKVYKDSQGNRAKYLGSGKWEPQ